jgi:uncharacterized protein (TIGR00255 family)
VTASSVRSMTGFGRAHRDVAGLRLVCEVRTLNQKGVDVKVRLPHGASSLEPRITQLVKAAFERGRVEVSFDVQGDAAAVDVAAVRALVVEARALSAALGVTTDVTGGDVLRALAGSQRRDTTVDVDAAGPAILDALGAALAACVAARASEGAALARLVEQRLDAVADLREKLRERTKDAPQRLADKLRARLDSAKIDAALLDGARLAQEAALLADRVDVSEEIERLGAHVGQGRVLLASSSSPGRKLDFLCQELLREANTLGSKVQDAGAAHLVVELKAEIEKMREQIQNVE